MGKEDGGLARHHIDNILKQPEEDQLTSILKIF